MLNVNSTGLYKVFRDFYTLTGIVIVLYDKDMNVLMQYPEKKNTFCSLIAKNAEWAKKCDECDRKNTKICARGENVSEYFCHLGLFEAVTPIYDDNGIFGYVMFGQVLLEDGKHEKIKADLKNRFSEADFPGIFEAIDNIPVKSSAELNACVTVLQALTEYMLSNRYVAPGCSEFIRHMDKYIEDNIENNISVDDICTEFRIKRTRLYSIAKDYLGCSLAAYIRKKRINFAADLLKNTDDSISTVAYKSGFSEYGHFSRVFKKTRGISAGAYRKKCRSDK